MDFNSLPYFGNEDNSFRDSNDFHYLDGAYNSIRDGIDQQDKSDIAISDSKSFGKNDVPCTNVLLDQHPAQICAF